MMTAGVDGGIASRAGVMCVAERSSLHIYRTETEEQTSKVPLHTVLMVRSRV